jgi:hypothetical protein
LKIQAGLLSIGRLGFMPSQAIGDTVNVDIDSDAGVSRYQKPPYPWRCYDLHVPSTLQGKESHLRSDSF